MKRFLLILGWLAVPEVVVWWTGIPLLWAWLAWVPLTFVGHRVIVAFRLLRIQRTALRRVGVPSGWTGDATALEHQLAVQEIMSFLIANEDAMSWRHSRELYLVARRLDADLAREMAPDFIKVRLEIR